MNQSVSRNVIRVLNVDGMKIPKLLDLVKFHHGSSIAKKQHPFKVGL